MDCEVKQMSKKAGWKQQGKGRCGSFWIRKEVLVLRRDENLLSLIMYWGRSRHPDQQLVSFNLISFQKFNRNVDWVKLCLRCFRCVEPTILGVSHIESMWQINIIQVNNIHANREVFCLVDPVNTEKLQSILSFPKHGYNIYVSPVKCQKNMLFKLISYGRLLNSHLYALNMYPSSNFCGSPSFEKSKRQL